jgi:hypothetical protein
VELYGDLDVFREQIVDLGMEYGITVGRYTAMVLTAYDVSEEASIDDLAGTYPTPIPTDPWQPAEPCTPGPTPTATAGPAAAFNPSLSIVTGAVGVGVTLFVGAVLLISRSRRGL